ncbi:MAG: hypothetical protein JJ865_15920, partial [Parvibaculum sp.]|nr:hypothetical protein [Parvibaculum sp.]
MSGSKSVSEEERAPDEGAPGRPDLAVALDAIYGYATDPENWEEMSSLLDEIGAGADIEPVAEGMRAHLSRAEDLARRLHETAPDDNLSPAYCHMVIGRDLRVADISDAAREMLAPFCKPLAPGNPLLFTDPENAARFRAHAASVTQGAVGPVLLRLVLEDGEEAVFGYLVAE